jgi:hypothetical protein
MRKIRIAAAIAAAAAFACVIVPAASAQATRTWVSGVGDDANPCSRTAPCKTFAGAISKTAAGGEISALDPGGYGSVTITKSISIVAAGVAGSILASSTNGVIINVGDRDIVNLRGLLIEGSGTGIAGIRVIGGGKVTIDSSLVRGFLSENGTGIDIQPRSAAQVFVTNTVVEANTRGVYAKSAGAAAPASVFLDRSQIVQNTQAGVSADAATILLNTSTLTGNGTAIAMANGGSVASLGNNAIAGNGGGEAPTAKRALQ